MVSATRPLGQTAPQYACQSCQQGPQPLAAGQTSSGNAGDARISQLALLTQLEALSGMLLKMLGGNNSSPSPVPGLQASLGPTGNFASNAPGLPATASASGAAPSNALGLQANPTGASNSAPNTQADPELVNKLPDPLKNLASTFQDAGQKYGIDPKFLAAISMLETGSGTSKAFKNQNNAMGVSNSKGPISFSDPKESIYKMAKNLADKNGPYAKANTIASIGNIYSPPGASNDPNGTNGYWPKGVAKFYSQLGGDPSQAVLTR